MTENVSMDRRTAIKFAGLAVASATVGGTLREAIAAPRVLPEGSLPGDSRLGALKDLDGEFLWKPSATLVDWRKRLDVLRRQMLVATGLWPMPTKTPLNAIVHGRVERDGYSVEKVILQTADGLFCTGNFYRPSAKPQGKYPAVLCPHGHWKGGRFHQHTDELFEIELQSKAESLPSGRYPQQARCVQLARMGCLVFFYDMLGFADNQSISFELAHGFKLQRKELSSPDNWGLYSAQAELRCLSVAGLQTWNSIRALDWISAMDDVDPDRIGVTGSSGGATQTLLLGAVDGRPYALFPSVMISTSMQGGCTCENASYLRVNTGNVEIAAMLAPRPLGMTAADDWTSELEINGLPELQEHYALFGYPNNVVGKYLPFPHNDNQQSRQLMYEFFNTHLKLNQPSPIVERDFVPLTKEEATVWNVKHPAVEPTVENELRIVRRFATDQERQFKALIPHDLDSQKQYREVIGGAWDAMIGRKISDKDEIVQDIKEKFEADRWLTFRSMIQFKKYGEEIPSILLMPRNWNKHVAVWITDAGKASLMGANGAPNADVQVLLDAGVCVMMPDLLFQGEFLIDGQQMNESRKVRNPREFAGYTLGYNDSLFTQRVHDVLTLLGFCRYAMDEPLGVHLIGVGQVAGAIAAAAASQAGDMLNKVAIGTHGFRFASLTNIYDPMLLPGAVRYGDIPGLLGLIAPHPLWVSGEVVDAQSVVTKCYEKLKGTGVTAHAGPATNEVAEAVKWLLKGLLVIRG